MARWYTCRSAYGEEFPGKEDIRWLCESDCASLEEERRRKEEESGGGMMGTDEGGVGVKIKGGLYVVTLDPGSEAGTVSPAYKGIERGVVRDEGAKKEKEEENAPLPLRVVRALWFYERRKDKSWGHVGVNVEEQLEAFKLALDGMRDKVTKEEKEICVVGSGGEVYNGTLLKRCEEDSWVEGTIASAKASAVTRLRRGWGEDMDAGMTSDEEETIKEEEQLSKTPIDHVFLVVHGIGQLWGGIFDIWQDTSQLRKRLHTIASVHMPEAVKEKGRVELIPVQWRLPLKFPSEDITERLRPKGLNVIRDISHKIVLDVFHYYTPPHREKMLACLVRELNESVKVFLQLNPAFCGKISIIGHSLGGVLCYDILSRQPNAQEIPAAREGCEEAQRLREEMAKMQRRLSEIEGTLEECHQEKLSFDVSLFYLLGSPLGLFLALRSSEVSKRSGLLLEGPLPRVKSLFNIYHPYDFVAYRLEPLIVPDSDRAAVYVPCAIRGGKKIHIEMAELGQDLMAEFTAGKNRLSSVVDVIASFDKSWTDKYNEAIDHVSGIVSQFGNLSMDLLEHEEEDSPPPDCKRASSSSDQGSDTRDNSPYRKRQSFSLLSRKPTPEVLLEGTPARIMDILTGSPQGRLDFVIQEAPLNNQYIAALTSHQAYFSNDDVCLFIIGEVYKMA